MATSNPYLKGLATGGGGVNQTTGMSPYVKPKAATTNLGIGGGGLGMTGALTQPGGAGGMQNMQAMGPQPLGGALAPAQTMQATTAMQPMQSFQPQTSNLGMGGPTMGATAPSTAGSTPAWMSPTTPATTPQASPSMGAPFNGSGAPTMGQGGMGVNPALASQNAQPYGSAGGPVMGGAGVGINPNLAGDGAAPAAPKTLTQYYKDRLAYMQQTGQTNPPPHKIPGWEAGISETLTPQTGPQSAEDDAAQTLAYRALQMGKPQVGPKELARRAQMHAMQGGNGQPLGMGGTGQNLGMGGINSYSPSPYLQQQLTGLQGQFNENLGNTLHSQNQQAVSTGNLGSSRSGLMAGQAIGDSQTGFANAATNMLGADYQAQMARNLQNKGLDQSLYLGNQANDTARFGIQTGANTAKYSTDAQTGIAQGQLGLGYSGLANAYNIAGLNSDTQKYGIDSQANTAAGQLGLGYLNANNQMTLGQGNLALGNKNSDQTYSLGQTANQNAANQNANSFLLGQGANQNAANQNANSFLLGQQANANTATGLANSYQLGSVANQNTANANNNQYQIQSVANANNANANNNNFFLGQQQNTTQAQQVANNYALGNQNSMLGFYGDMRNQDRADFGMGLAAYGQGVNGPWNPINQQNGLLAPYSGQGTTNQTTGGQPGGWQGALGGGLTGYALAKQMGWI